MQDLVLVLHLQIPDGEAPIDTLMAVESALVPVTRGLDHERIWTIQHDATRILRVAHEITAENEEDR